MLQKAIKRIYDKEYNVMSEVDEGLFNETYRILTQATNEGVAMHSSELSPQFRAKMDRNTAMFSAFKVHRMQNDVAAQLYTADGALRTFREWKQEVAPILDHNINNWLQTEYNTAVLRADMAAQWQRFERESDILPNLEWMPTTSAEADPVHASYVGTILPIEHPFWLSHYPGDRWGCKCGLESTDQPATEPPYTGDEPPASPGIDNNPGIDGKLFSDSHPYQVRAYEGAEGAVIELIDRLFE